MRESTQSSTEDTMKEKKCLQKEKNRNEHADWQTTVQFSKVQQCSRAAVLFLRYLLDHQP